MAPQEPVWLGWAKELQAIAQNGLHYSQNPFDIERYERLRHISAEMWAMATGAPPDSFLKLFVEQTGHATPKVDVRGVVIHNERLLLVQERSDGGWTLPGGWADPNETPREAVVREIREESGYETTAGRLLALYDRSKHGHPTSFPFHIYKIFIACHFQSGEPLLSHEISGINFYSKAELKTLTLSESRTTLWQLERMFALSEQIGLPPDLD
jgi:ADP-ribose pyrophosphatase YjhB (NUDIX family)